MLSISNTHEAGEPVYDGEFTVSLTKAADQDTVVNYVVAGTANSGTDFAALSGSVTIAAGETEATIDVSVIDDNLLEVTETVVVTLNNIASGDADIAIDTSANSATVTIADDEKATVVVLPSDGNAGEPSNGGQFTVSLNILSATDTVINYVVTGTAGADNDYVSLPGSVTILAGESSATIDVSVLNDDILEESETVIVTLTGTNDPDVSINTGADFATVTIADEDTATLSIAANDPTAAEPGDDGQFTITLSQASDQDTVIDLVITGTATSTDDYTAIPATVTIAAGAKTATVDVSVIDSDLLEESETVVVTLAAISSGDSDITINTAANSAVVTINDDDVATLSIAPTDNAAGEPGNDGLFTVTLSEAADQDTVINYLVTGTANAGTDYETLAGTITIAAGETSATIDVRVVNDTILEDGETVIVTLGGIASGDSNITVDSTPAVVNVTDDDTALVSIIASDSTASEPDNDGEFTVIMSAASDKDTIVNYLVTGTAGEGDDYTTLSGSVTIAAGTTSATIALETLDDLVLEDNETVIVTLTGTLDPDAAVDTSTNVAKIVIADNDSATASIAVTDSDASEPGDNGRFTVTISAISDKDTVVDYVVTGTAGAGSDYTTLTGSVTIAAGTDSAVIDVNVVDSDLLEDNETVIVTLIGTDDSDITIDNTDNTATIVITDDDTATVSILATDSDAGEPTNDGLFTITMDQVSDKDTVINYAVTGTAGPGTDYMTLSGSVTIEAGLTTATIDVKTIDDGILEDSETVIVTLTGTSDSDVTATGSATVTIVDDDLAKVSIAANDSGAAEPNNDGQFTVTMTAASDKDTTINYTVAGTAADGSDYNALSGSVVIAAGSKTATIDVETIDNAILEDAETVIVTLSGTTDLDVSVDTSANVATVTINDDDTASVSIAATDDTAMEPGDDGLFTVTMTSVSDTATVINYVITGTAGASDDYVTLAGSVTIAAGLNSATIDVATIDDGLLEDNETVIVTLTGTDNSAATIDNDNRTATVVISDEDKATVTIAANDPDASEPSDNGQFTVTMSAISDKDTKVNYTVTGTAGAGTDYATLSGSLIIAAGSNSGTIDVTVFDSELLEDTETVIITLIDTDDDDVTVASSGDSATVFIDDEDKATVAITANDASASEPSDHGQFTVTMSEASDKDTLVNLIVTGTADAGTDYITIPTSVTILAGETSAVIDLSVLDDAILEDNETVIVTLLTTDDADVTVDPSAAADSITIKDGDTATAAISVTDSTASEPGDDGEFTVTLSNKSDKDTVIDYVVTGLAESGSDFTTLTGSVTIAAGSLSETIALSVIDSDLLEDNESVIITLTGSNDVDVTIDATAEAATIVIADDDVATVSVMANVATASEPGTDGQFTVTMTDASDKDTLVSYLITGTAGNGIDFTTLSGTVVIEAGSKTATLDVEILDDAILEESETVILTLVGTDDLDVTVDSLAAVATVTIDDDDKADVSISAFDATASEPNDHGHFLVTMTNASDKDTVIDFVVTGTADSGDDYTALPASITIAAGETSAMIDVSVIDDNLLESSETVVVTLTNTSDADASIDTAANTATITIADDDTAKISITANDGDSGEPDDDGQFTIELSKASDQDTVVNLLVTGTATASDDYVAIPTTATILAGETTVTLDVTVIDSDLLEELETVVVTISGISSADPEVSISNYANSATVTIADDDTATVTVAATDATAGEPIDNGLFTITLSKASDRDTFINYVVTGSATAADDFIALPGVVKIAAGETTATIDLTALDDTILEDDESVTLTLTSIAGGDADVSIDTTASSATVAITDNDTATVSIAATDADAGEPGNAGQFTITMSAASDKDTEVTYTVMGTASEGTDYTALSGKVTIGAGETFATIDLSVIDDAILEESETVIVTLIKTDDLDVSVDITDNTATIIIEDDDVATATIVANDADAAEPTDNGQFTVTLSNAADQDTVISYLVSGDATADVDYDALSGTVTIVAGQTSATIDVSILNDDVLEDDETIIVTLDSIDSGDNNITIGAGNTATINLLDDDAAGVKITATDPTANESGDTGAFTIELSQLSDTDTVIAYVVSGDATADVDYGSLLGTVTIVAGQTTATIDVAAIDDSLLEDDENVTVTLTGFDSADDDIVLWAANTATVTIGDNDTAEVSVTANDADAGEASDNGQFTVSLSLASDTDTVIGYTISGDATADADYDALSGSVTIAAGELSATIDVAVIDDSVHEATETLTIQIDSIDSGDDDITIGLSDTATVTITDDDAAEVTIVANDSTAGEPGDDGQFTVTLSNPSDTDTVIEYTIGGDASSGTDYAAISSTLTIAAGETSATIDISVLDDGNVELPETVSITLDRIAAGTVGITIGTNDTASVSISDDDTTTVSIQASDATANESGDNGQFTVTLSTAAPVDTIVTYSVTGSATPDDDYTALTGSVLFQAGQTSATIDVTAIDNLILEEDETVVVTLTGSDQPFVEFDPDTDTATVVIEDNDSAEITIVANDPNAAEATPLDHGQMTISLSAISDSDTTIHYTVTGTADGGDDYVALPGSVTIAAGHDSATLDVTLIDDYLLELNETVIVTLDSITGDGDISIGSANAATVTIADNEVNPPTLSVPSVLIADEDTTMTFAISASTVQTDGSEVLQVLIEGIADGVTLSDGVNSFTGSATLSSIDVTSWNRSQLLLTNQANSDSDFDLTVKAIATSSDPTDDTPAAITSEPSPFALTRLPTLRRWR